MFSFGVNKLISIKKNMANNEEWRRVVLGI